MKRVLRPYKVLAVALSAAACHKPAPDPVPETSQAPAPRATPARSAPPPDPEVPTALLALRAELETVAAPEALARLSHFRPLCDAEGYPLVGNMARKAPPGADRNAAPSTFCAAVRARKDTGT